MTRYLLNQPQLRVFDVVRHCILIATVYLTVSVTFPQGEHVQIEMLRDRISVRLRDWLETTWSLMAATVFALMARGACLAGPEQRNQQVLADAGQTAQQHLCAFLDGMPVQDEWATTLDGTGRPDTEVLEAYRPASSEF